MTLEDDLRGARAQVAALICTRRSQLRRWRLLEVRCGKCGMLVVEAFATSPLPYLLWHVDDVIGVDDAVLPPAGGLWPAPPELIEARCKCARHPLLAETLRAMALAPRREGKPHKHVAQPQYRKIRDRPIGLAETSEP